MNLRNFYECDKCGIRWDYTYTSPTNDKCVKCGKETETHKIEESQED